MRIEEIKETAVNQYNTKDVDLGYKTFKAGTLKMENKISMLLSDGTIVTKYHLVAKEVE